MNPLNHVAIIMDGNGRWGLKKNKTRNDGHKAGLKTVETVINLSLKKNIKFLTLYAFSTENWKRPKVEIKYLFNLLENFLKNKISELNKKNIKFNVIGNKNFKRKLKKLILKSENTTSENTKLQINLALNYGSKNEIINSVKNILKKKEKVNEKNISKNLYTKNIPDPDILIRTGNTKRLSNFLLWQISYTEIYFIKKLWPEFNEKDYLKIINSFKRIKRNYGSV